MRYAHVPVRFDAPQEADLQAFIAAMREQAGARTHVHCVANYRVTAFLGLYRALALGMPEAQAFEPMRTIWEPDAVWAAFIARMLG